MKIIASVYVHCLCVSCLKWFALTDFGDLWINVCFLYLSEVIGGERRGGGILKST